LLLNASFSFYYYILSCLDILVTKAFPVKPTIREILLSVTMEETVNTAPKTKRAEFLFQHSFLFVLRNQFATLQQSDLSWSYFAKLLATGKKFSKG